MGVSQSEFVGFFHNHVTDLRSRLRNLGDNAHGLKLTDLTLKLILNWNWFSISGKRIKLRVKSEGALNEVFTAYLCSTCSSYRWLFCFFPYSTAENPASKHHVMFYATDSLEQIVKTTTLFVSRMQVV